MEYKIIYSKRKSLAIQVTPDGEVLVKAPKNTPKKNIEETVKKYSDWIEKTQKKVLGKDIGMKKASAEEEKLLRKKARELLPEKVNYSAIFWVSHQRGSPLREQGPALAPAREKTAYPFHFILCAFRRMP